MFSFKNQARIMPDFKYNDYTIILYVADHSIYPDPVLKAKAI